MKQLHIPEVKQKAAATRSNQYAIQLVAQADSWTQFGKIRKHVQEQHCGVHTAVSKAAAYSLTRLVSPRMMRQEHQGKFRTAVDAV